MFEWALECLEDRRINLLLTALVGTVGKATFGQLSAEEMKLLTIIRHAKSSWDMPAVEDFYRPLSKRGVQDAFAVGEELAARGVFPDLLVTSPAVRAINTAIIIARKLDFPQQRVVSNDRIYEASTEDLFKVVAGTADSIGHLMLFGHNPSLTMFINRLQDVPLDNLPTCGVYHLSSNIASWTDVGKVKATTVFSLFPKEL
jgi:phosphohistidine phosphatase